MKQIRFGPGVPAEIRAIPREDALAILRALHRYGEMGEGNVKALTGDLKGLLRLRVGNYRLLFDETETSIQVHRVADRKDAYR
ncbi:MAG: type II toxin-antitoxin system RelE/ParE family toxin [Acidobacteria bacterium]|nr:type II toxin-antitoxin system RelE/ParE family toxin [Acidobacteriota bacterium]